MDRERRISRVLLPAAVAALAGILGVSAAWSEGSREFHQSGPVWGRPVQVLPAARAFELAGFDEIQISSGFDAEIRQDDRFSVLVRIEDGLVPYLRVQKVGRTLWVGLHPGARLALAGRRPRVEITLPRLRLLSLSGAARATLGDFRFDRVIEVKLSGASDLKGRIQAQELELDISGASRLELSGSAADVQIEASGASEADLEGLAVRSARVELSGASHALVKLEGRLDLRASGASRLLYAGRPQLGRIELSGSSSLRAY
jgi:hypothetical protein